MKKLQVGITKIGERTGKYDGKYVRFSIYYGNYSMPPVNGEYVHLKKDKYLELLDDFLSSEEGSCYERPTEEEIEDACLLVVNRELEEKKRQSEKKEPQPEEAEKPQLYEKTDVQVIEKADVKVHEKEEKNLESEKYLLYRKEVRVLSIAVLFLVLLCAFQMLLNLYLFIR